MINVSNEYRNTITNERLFKLKAILTFSDGTTFEVNDSDIMQNGMSFDEATSNKNSFQIGYAYIGSYKLILNNFDGKFDEYDFTDATVIPYVGLQLSDTIEYLKKGFYTVDDPGTGGNIITLTCFDNMHKFARPFSEVEIVFPTTAQILLVTICQHCGVPLATPTFDNDDYIINERPIDDALSCLDIVSFIGQVTGNYAKCNVDGALEMKWYDLSAFEESDSFDGGTFSKIKIDIVRIEGASYQEQTDLSPDHPSPIISAKNFTITASNGKESNSVVIYDTLRSNLSKTVRDTYEVIDGHFYKIQRMAEVVLDGTQGTIEKVDTYEKDNTLYFRIKNVIPGHVVNNQNDTNFASDRFKPRLINNIDEEGIMLYNNLVAVRINKTRLASLDVEGVKAWLAQNPITIQYELVEPICTTVPPITLKGYGNRTEITTDANPEVAIYTTTRYIDGDNINGGNFTDYTSGDNVDGGTFYQMKRYHHFYNFGSTPTVSVDDVVITGIKVSYAEDEETYTKLFGTEGYVLSIENNPLIQSKEDADLIASRVGLKIVGMKFRPFSANVLSDPSVQAGDPCYVSIRTSRGYITYQSYITSLLYTVGQRMRVSCDAETPSRNSSTKYSAETKTVVENRKRVEKKLTAYNLAVQQLTNLMANSFGVHKTEEKLEDGSTIYYLHDKPTLSESQTIWKMTANTFTVSTDGGKTWNAGFDSQGNAVLNILSAIGINAEWIKVLTNFTVGEHFNVDANGKLTAKNADIQGKITAQEGTIANAAITETGLEMANPGVNDYFKIQVGNTSIHFSPAILSLYSSYLFYTSLTGRSVFQISDDGFTLHTLTDNYFYQITANNGQINMYVTDLINGQYKNDGFLINGQPILTNFASLQARVIHMMNFLIQRFGYDPTA